MAEIRIERKRRGLGWLWLLLALLIVAVLAWYFLYPGRTTTAPAAAPPATGAIQHTAPATTRASVVHVVPLAPTRVPRVVPGPAQVRRVSEESAVGGRYGEEG
jgi:hypothetical protein